MAGRDVERLAAELVRAGLKEGRARRLALSAPANLGGLFQDNKSLRRLDLSGWDTTRVRNLSAMFSGCSSLESLDLSGWDVSGVGPGRGVLGRLSPQGMRYMLQACTSLRELRVPARGYLDCEETGAAWSLPSGALILVPEDLLGRYLEGWGGHGFRVVAASGRTGEPPVTGRPAPAGVDWGGMRPAAGPGMPPGDMSFVAPGGGRAGGATRPYQPEPKAGEDKPAADQSALLAGLRGLGLASGEASEPHEAARPSQDQAGSDDGASKVDREALLTALRGLGLGGTKPEGEAPEPPRREQASERADAGKPAADQDALLAGLRGLGLGGGKSGEAPEPTRQEPPREEPGAEGPRSAWRPPLEEELMRAHVPKERAHQLAERLSTGGTSRVESMGGMFKDCYFIERLDLSGLDTSAVIDMSSLFEGCFSLESLDLSLWDTSAVTNMESMFNGCSSLGSIGLSKWDVSRVGSLSSMFEDCRSLRSLDLSRWDTSGARDMSWTFAFCESLEVLDLSGWDVSGVADVHYMLFDCESLRELHAPRAGYLGCEGTAAAGYLPRGARVVVPKDLLGRYQRDWGAHGFKVMAYSSEG